VFVLFQFFLYHHRFVDFPPRLPLPPGGSLWDLSLKAMHIIFNLLSIFLDKRFFSRTFGFIMAQLSSPIREGQHQKTYQMCSWPSSSELTRCAGTKNTTAASSTCCASSSSMTLTARYYIFILLAAIPVLSWNLSMHNMWSEMSSLEDEFLILNQANNNRRVNNSLSMFYDSANSGLSKVNSDQHVLDKSMKEAATVDIQYTELPNGLALSVKRPRPPPQTTTTAQPTSEQARPHAHKNVKNSLHRNQAETASMLPPPPPPPNQTRFRIRVSREGGNIDIKDPDDKLISRATNHHQHQYDNTSTVTLD
jgi:hypothetical protein